MRSLFRGPRLRGESPGVCLIRDPARIDRILGLLRVYWKNYPDLRLYQMLLNFYTEEPGWAYYVEDDWIEATLRKELKQRVEEQNGSPSSA